MKRSSKCGRHPLGRVPFLGDGRSGRHILDLSHSHLLRNGYVDGLLHDALGISLLRGNDLLRKRVDDLLDSALLDVLLCLGLGVDAPSLIGAVGASPSPRRTGQRRARASRKRASGALCDGGRRTRRRLLRQGRPLASL